MVNVVAVLCRHKALDIKDMYLYLSVSDEKMRNNYDQHMERVLKQIKQFNIKKTATDDTKKEEEIMDAAPHSTTGDDNQKLHVTAALLQVGVFL